jgi:hypothetical protein
MVAPPGVDGTSMSGVSPSRSPNLASPGYRSWMAVTLGSSVSATRLNGFSSSSTTGVKSLRTSSMRLPLRRLVDAGGFL